MLARARGHIVDLEIQGRKFHEERPYERVTYPDGQGRIIIAIRLNKPIPEDLDNIAFDAVSNLRSALDQTLYSAAIASGHAIRFAKFPFHETADAYNREINGKTYLPEEIRAFLRWLKCYKGENDFLCAMNDIANTNKHAILSATGVGAIRTKGKFHATGYMSVPTKPEWDSSKNEIVIATVGPDTHFEYDVDFGFTITFSEIEGLKGLEASTVLHHAADIVERIPRTDRS